MTSVVAIPVFYDSSVTNENATAALLLKKYPNATLYDTIGLTHGGSDIDTLISGITAGASDYAFNLTETDSTATGCLSATQVTNLTATLSGTFSTATKTFAQTSGSGDTLLNQPRIAWTYLFPKATNINPLIMYLGGNKGLNLIDVSGTATGGSATTIIDSGANFGTSSTNSTATSITQFTLTKSAAGWTVNSYAGYYLTITNGTYAGKTCLVKSNTATVLTLTDALPLGIVGTTPTYNVMTTTLKGKYVRTTPDASPLEARLIIGNNTTTLFVDNAFTAAIDSDDDYSVYHYLNSNYTLADFIAPLGCKTYLRNMALTSVAGLWSKIIDDNPLTQVVSEKFIPGTDSIADIMNKGAAIYAYNNLSF